MALVAFCLQPVMAAPIVYLSLHVPLAWLVSLFPFWDYDVPLTALLFIEPESQLD